MKKVLLALFLCFSVNSNLFASITNVEVNGRNFEAIFSCQDKEKILQEINLFHQQVNSSKSCEQDHITEDGGGKCRLDLNSCLPTYMANKLGTTYPVSGPNCYGTSLYTTQNYDYVRFVSVKEFDAIVTSSFCQKREEAGTGVIGYFANNETSIHAFTHITKNLSFERMGFDLKGDIYPFIANFVPYTHYKWEADSYCRRYASETKECYNKLNFVTCDLSSFFDSLPDAIDIKLKRIEKSVNTLILDQVENSDRLILDMKNEIELTKAVLTTLDLELQSKKIVSEMLDSLYDQIESVERYHHDR